MSKTALTVVVEPETAVITLADGKSHLRVTHDLEDSHISNLIKSANAWAEDYTNRLFIDQGVTLQFDKFPTKGETIGIRGDVFADVFYFPTSTFSRLLKTNARDRGIVMPGGKVTAVNDIRYTDEDGNPQILNGPTSQAPSDDYQEDLTDNEWPMVFPKLNETWFSTQDGLINAVQIDYDVGWFDETEVPEAIRHAVRFKLGDLYTIRDTADAGSKSSLLTAAENLLFPWIVQQV